MQVIDNLKIKEKLYIEKLENGLTVMIIPKKDIQKKYVIFGTNFGSIDNKFVVAGQEEPIEIPDGVAHFLEHKMFEQKSGVNSLDKLSSLGVNANAYTTNDHTAYLFEATDNFYEALDEFMDYIQNPYYTDENVEKEKGIIAQEIKMYDDHPGWQVYMNAMKCMYNNFPIKIDIAGTVDSISAINKEILYNCYNTFYHPSNMALVICGDFKPEDLLQEVKKRLLNKPQVGDIKRIYPEEKDEICEKEKNVNMEVSNPLFVLGYKDKNLDKNDIVKKHITIEILLNMIIGKSSKLYKRLYEECLLLSQPDLEYEFSKQYAHILISGQSRNPKKVIEEIKQQIEQMKVEGLDEEEFNRIKKKIYGDYVTEYNDVGDIARMFLADFFKGINSFEYIENYNLVGIEYAQQILKECFRDENSVISIVNGK